MAYKYNIWFCAKKSFSMFAIIYLFEYANASDRICVDKNIEKCDPINLISDLGSDLPKRVENYSRIFSEGVSFYPIDHASHHYDGEKITDGIAKVAQDIQLHNGVVLSFIELRMTNSPYVSEVYLQFNNREKYNCLHTSEVKEKLLSSYKNIDENKFYYSYVLNVMLKISSEVMGRKLCISNIDMRYIIKIDK